MAAFLNVLSLSDGQRGKFKFTSDLLLRLDVKSFFSGKCNKEDATVKKNKLAITRSNRLSKTRLRPVSLFEVTVFHSTRHRYHALQSGEDADILDHLYETVGLPIYFESVRESEMFLSVVVRGRPSCRGKRASQHVVFFLNHTNFNVCFKRDHEGEH